jgi:hypothetical protein
MQAGIQRRGKGVCNPKKRHEILNNLHKSPLTSLWTSDSLLEGFSSEAVFSVYSSVPVRGLQPYEYDEVRI